MEKLLILVSVDAEGNLNKAAKEVFAAALSLTDSQTCSSFEVGLFGETVGKAATELGDLGAGRILVLEDPALKWPRYSTDVRAVEALVRESGASLVIAPSTSRMARCIPAAATRLNGEIDTHINAFENQEGNLNVKRWFYRQRMMGCLTRKKRPWFLTIDQGVFAPWTGNGTNSVYQAVSVDFPQEVLDTMFERIEKPASDSQTIRPDANLLFVAGAGWTKKQADGQVHSKDAETLIKGFLDTSGASLGSSKSLVDQSHEGEAVLSFMSHLNQVGQTGSTPRHPKGLATCCHGEEPHVVGWRFINERRAINKDPNCGWARGKADKVYVADAFEVIQKLNDLLGS